MYDVHVFDSETAAVYDAETSGKEDLICRGCGKVLDPDDPLNDAMEKAWGRYIDYGKATECPYDPAPFSDLCPDRTRLREQARAVRRAAASAPLPAKVEAETPTGWTCAGIAVMDWLCRNSDRHGKAMIWLIFLFAAYMSMTQVCPGLFAGAVDFLKGD